MKSIIPLFALSMLVACGGTSTTTEYDTKPLSTKPAQPTSVTATISGMVVLSSTAVKHHTLEAAKAAKIASPSLVKDPSRRYIEGPSNEFVTYNVIKDHGDVVELTHYRLTSLGQSRQCTGRRDGSYSSFNAVVFVPKGALTPVLNKSITRTYDDGTSYTLTAGVPLKRFDAGPVKGWVGIAHDHQFPVKITPKDMSLSVPQITPLPRRQSMTTEVSTDGNGTKPLSTSIKPLGLVHQVAALKLGGKPAWNTSAPTTKNALPAGAVLHSFGVIQRMSKTATGDTLVTLNRSCLEVTATLDSSKNQSARQALLGGLMGNTIQPNMVPIIRTVAKSKMFWKSNPEVQNVTSIKQARVYPVGDAFCTKSGALGFAKDQLCVSAKHITYSCASYMFDSKRDMGKKDMGKLRVSDDKKSCVNIP